MNPEYIHERLEETAEDLEGSKLKHEVETLLEEEGINYNIIT